MVQNEQINVSHTNSLQQVGPGWELRVEGRLTDEVNTRTIGNTITISLD